MGQPQVYPPEDQIDEIPFTEEAIARRVAEIGQQIADDLEGEVPLLIGILKGSVVFVADLMRAIAGPVEIDFLAVSSYGESAKSSGVVKILKDLDRNIEGRHVIIVEDIIDTGLTIGFLHDYLATREAASIRTATLLLRQRDDGNGVRPDYVGFEIPPSFVVGYGLDVGEKFRNLPYLATWCGDSP